MTVRNTVRLQDLRLTNVLSTVGRTPNNNLFLECNTTVGRVAFWGTDGDTRNIDQIRGRRFPFTVRCGCIEASLVEFPGHGLWIPQYQELHFSDK